MKYVLGIGSVFDGIYLYGPFSSLEKAREVGKEYTSKSGQDWCVVRLGDPSTLFPTVSWLEKTFNEGMIP